MGDLDDTPAEAVWRARVRGLLEGRLAPRRPGAAASVLGAGSDDLDAGRAFLAALAPDGLAAPSWPVAYGGMGATPAEASIVAHELANFEQPDLYPFMVGIALVGPVLLTHGTDAQRARWLPPIGAGEEIWCQLFSEPDAGSDLASLRTRAEPDGDGWRVTGTKVWSSRAHYADRGLLLARTDPGADKHAGITAFAMTMRQPGVEVRPLRQMNGDVHFNEVFLDGAFVSGTDRIGGAGEGWRVATTTLVHERGALAGGPGLRGEQFLELVRASGGADAVGRDRVADAWAGLEVARLSGMRARANSRVGRAPGPEGSGAKLRWTRALKRVADVALDLEGPAGMAGPGGEWRTLFLTAPSLSIRGGTDEIQRDILGERVLGLPREPGRGGH